MIRGRGEMVRIIAHNPQALFAHKCVFMRLALKGAGEAYSSRWRSAVSAHAGVCVVGGMKFLVLAAALAGVALAGCADTHAVRSIAQPQQKLAMSNSVYVSVPDDGHYGKTIYSGSGKTAANIVAAAFRRRLPMVEVATQREAMPQAVAAAKAAGVTHLVAPEILHWEDRATEWSGKPDRAELDIRIIDVSSGAIIAHGVISGKSGLGTFGGDHPQDLLPQAVEEYVEALF